MTTEHSPQPRFGRNLLLRFVTALPLAVAVVAGIAMSSYGLFVFCFVVATASVLELYALVGLRWRRPVVALSVLAMVLCWLVLLMSLSVQYYGLGPYVLPLLLLLVPAITILLLFDKQIANSPATLGYLLLGWVYVVLPFVLLYMLGHPPALAARYSSLLPLGILLILWANDVGAYFAGKFFGRHKLFPRVSPGKTWEGAVGGALVALLLAGAATYAWPQRGLSWYVIAGLIVVFGTLGDLAESQLKRQLGLKDSGGLLPGHGGLLDRFDGLLLAMPPVFLYTLYAQA